ncbi:MAG: hypothetical protein OSB07_11530 [Dehalococcoidia bacterium]|nr:hypothetical protein [Dehalococcoidia bacterium]
MKTYNWSKHFRITALVISLLVLAIGCGGGSGGPVYSGSSIYQEVREGQAVVIFDLSITDADGDPYTKGLLAQGAAFTPLSSYPIAFSNVDGLVQIVVEATVPGKYSIGIDGFLDTKGVMSLPVPEDENVNGKILLSHDYAP